MLIRCKGYNTGAKEYLEEGKKEGREFSRNELDERVILDGDLDLTQMVYESLPDNGQNRYLSFTMAFREDVISQDTLLGVTAEFKQFLMYAYKSDEFNFYAEAHLPKIRQIRDKKTGEMIDRKPHIHIIIPRKNLISGNEANPVGMYSSNERYFEAFQEYINQKYNLASPREHVRVDPQDAASVLSRYKGDDFYGKNREFKQELVKQVITAGVVTRKGFYDLVASYGEVKIRNKDKENEYIAVKLPGDAKFTNLKDTIFQDDFVVRRQLKKPPLEQHVIRERLGEWSQRAKELKYVSKATPYFRKLYKEASPEERTTLLSQREQKFYSTYGESNVIESRTTKRTNRSKRSTAETEAKRSAETAPGVQDMSIGNVATDGQTGKSREPHYSELLHGDAHVHLGQQNPGGNIGLRPPLREGGRGRHTEGRFGRHSSLPAPATNRHVEGVNARAAARKQRPRIGDVTPIYARDPRRRPTVADIEERGRRLFNPFKQAVDSPLSFELAVAISPGGTTSRDPPPGDEPGTIQSRIQRRPRSTFSSKPNVPPYALDPHRVATITDIEARTRRLFAPFNAPVDSALVMKLATFKKVAVNRNASTVAAYFNRQIEQNQLLPGQRKAVQRVNRQFSEIRRAIFSDDRLTKQDKAQLVSVLTFERMKVREAIQNPHPNKEATYMGSAEIRGLVNDEPQEDLPQFSISGPGPNAPTRDRVKALIARLTLQTDDKVSKERERELSAKDIYTKKSRFSQNVHYLSKTTDKTLFVDTGTSIAMRRTGITEAGVGVALQLATQRFGSTLTINGSAEFKRLVVEAAAKGGMDIHFTDKKMNEALTLRRAELDIEKEGQQIGAAGVKDTEAPSQEAIAPGEQAVPVVVDRSIIAGELVAHGPADYKGDPNNGRSYYVTLNTDAGEKTVWGLALKDAMADHEFAQGDRIKLKDLGREPVTIQKEQEDGSFKPVQGFRRAWQADPDTTTQASPAAAAPAQASSAAAPAQAAPATADATSPSELVRREAAWREKMQMSKDVVLTEAEVLSSDTMMGLRGEDHAIWLVATNDQTPEGVAMVTAYMENDQYREQFKSTIEKLYEQHQDSPEIIESLDEATAFAVPIVHEIEGRQRAAGPAFEQSQAAPAPLNFTHNGEVASLGLTPVPAPSVEGAEVVPGAPIVLVDHKGESVTVDPANAGDVAKHTRQLTHEVTVQSEKIVQATQRIGLLVNMRDNHSADREPGFIDQCNADIGEAERFIESGKAILASAETNLQKLTPAAISLAVSAAPAVAVPNVESMAASPRVETPAPLNFTHNGEVASLGLRPVPEPEAPTVVIHTVTELEDDFGPEMD